MHPFAPHSLRRVPLAFTLAATLLAASGLAQTSTPTTSPCKPPASAPTAPSKSTPCPAKPQTETSFSLGAFSQLTAARIDNANASFVTQSMNPSAGALGTIRQSFRPWLGYSLNMGYTRASEHSTDYPNYGPPSSVSNVSIPANIYELSLSYLAQKRLNPKLIGFTDLGVGMLAFLPSNPNGGPVNLPVNFRPLGVGGIGVDYLLSPHFSLRAEYRGQLYKFADYGDEAAKHLTVTSEPTLSLVYRLHRPRP